MIEGKTYNVAIYIRLSREDEDIDSKVESESITNQRTMLKSFVEEAGYNLVDEYVDDGISGTTFDRDSFNRMIKDIEAGKINTVITKDLSRFGRDFIEAGNYIQRYFPEKGIRFIALNDGYDSEVENYSDDMIPFKLVMNDMYAKDISKKVRSSVSVKKKQGLFLGWKACYGYKKDPNDKHKILVDEEASLIVKKMFKLASEGRSPSQIANIFSLEKIPTPSVYANLNRGMKCTAYELWCSRTIDEMLSNPTYAGHLTQGRRRKINYKSKKEIRTNRNDWIITPNNHEAIVDDDTFNKVQEIRAKTKRYRKQTDYLLAGYLYCKECGHAINVNRSKDRKRGYCVCTYYSKYSKFKVCTPHTLSYNKLEFAVLEDIKQMCKDYVDKTKLESSVKNYDIKKSKNDKLQKEIKDSEKMLQVLSDRLDKLYIDRLDDLIDISMYKRMSDKINDDIKLETQHLKDLNDELKGINGNINKNKINYIKKIEEYLSFEKPDSLVLSGLIDKILISENKEIDIYYKFNLD